MIYKTFILRGQIFFASTAKFTDMFEYTEDPDHIIVDFKNSHVWDHSAVNSISKIKRKYQDLGKQVSFVGLNKESNSVITKTDHTILGY